MRRGWVRTILRLGALEDGSFLEPEVGFCLHGLATSGGVMEAVCRAQVCLSGVVVVVVVVVRAITLHFFIQNERALFFRFICTF